LLGLVLAAASPAIPPWGFDLGGMDRSAKPGDDFDRYASGAWKQAMPIPPDRSAWGPFAMLRAKAESDVKAIVDDIAGRPQPAGSIERKIADAYNAYLDTKAIEAGLAAGEVRENAPVKLEVKKPLLGPGLVLGDLPLAGHLAPQFTLADDSRSDDRTGYSHVLLVQTAAAISSRLALSQEGINILTSDDASGLGPWLREHGIIAALVRPDRYVSGTACNETDLDRLIAAIAPPTHVPSAA
jgi:3-(3-hydroxy-phenyl)propionate hydroxylase